MKRFTLILIGILALGILLYFLNLSFKPLLQKQTGLKIQPKHQKYLSDPTILDNCLIGKRTYRVCLLKNKTIVPYDPKKEKLKPGDFVLVKMRVDRILTKQKDKLALNLFSDYQYCSYTSLTPTSTINFSQEYLSSVLFRITQFKPKNNLVPPRATNLSQEYISSILSQINQNQIETKKIYITCNKPTKFTGGILEITMGFVPSNEKEVLLAELIFFPSKKFNNPKEYFLARYESIKIFNLKYILQ